MRIVSDHARVRVPATSGNLGPGFDSMGMAHDVWDEISATLTTGTTRVTILGEGAKDLPHDESHLIVRVMHETMERFGLPQAGIELVCRNAIQQGKGMGSSAAAVVAGLMLVAGLTGGHEGGLTKEKILDMATEYEGHPDNAAPCIYGGATLSWFANEYGGDCGTSDVEKHCAERAGSAGDSSQTVGISELKHVRNVQLNVHPTVRTALLVPSDILPTTTARSVLPSTVSHKDAAREASRAAALVYALEHNPDLLFEATEDWLHQHYRASSMPRSAAMLQALRDAGWPAVISGAGPSILVFAEIDPALAQVVNAQGFQVIDSQQVPGAHLVTE